MQVISEITPLSSGRFLVELFNPDQSLAKAKVYDTLSAARGVCTRYVRRWPASVGITATYSNGEQRTYGDKP